MKIWDRFRVMGVLSAIAILIAALAQGFLAIDIQVFDTPLKTGIMLALFWLVAPWVAKVVEVGREED